VRLGAAAICSFLLLGCGLEDVDYTGKTCAPEAPCPSGYRCTGGVCARRGPDDPDCDPLIAPSNFRVGWTTPSTIRWEWDADPNRTVDQFQGYTITVAESEDALASGEGAVEFTLDQNPELGTYVLLYTNGGDLVQASITDGHLDSRTYFGRLTALDSAGCPFVSETLTALTRPKSVVDPIVLFSEIPRPGATSETLALGDDPGGAASGEAYYEWVASCDAPDTQCWQNLRLEGLAIAPSEIPLNEADFEGSAFLEMRVATNNAADLYWASVALVLDGCEAVDECLYAIEPYTFRADGAYRTLQLPLRALGYGKPPLTYQVLATRGIAGFWVGGWWSVGSWVRVDEVVIRW